MIEVKTIRYIKAIEEEGSFLKAAEALYISQPALSQYISRKEKELSIKLYERIDGKCILTEAGKILLNRGSELLDEFELMLQEMRETDEKYVRPIYFGCPTGYSVPWFSDLLNSSDLYNLKNINMMEDSVEVLLNFLLKKKMNIVFVPAVYHHPQIEYYTIRHEQHYLAVPKSFDYNKIILEKEKDGYANLSDLHGIPFISGPAKAYIELVRPLFEESGAPANVVFTAKNWDIAHSMVEKSVGCTIVPFWHVDHDSKFINYYKIRSNRNTHRIFSYALLKNQIVQDETRKVINYIIDKLGDSNANTLVKKEQLTLEFEK